MSRPRIEAEGLGKRYRIAAVQQHNTLRDRIAAGTGTALRRLVKPWRQGARSDERSPHFWALRDVSFTLSAGEVLGIIGPNGAGKSTLLKILSRITEPTAGRAVVRGRVGSLLEVGTGFHSELTGRENIYLSGSILGMTRAEIRRKFDEIVAFAEVERFVDTPVKHYSSGMYLRLAFGVAAHLEPEILIVDEVLAVGDAEFQRKCLGRMREVSGQDGRTVLFVSHNLDAIQQVCSSCMLLRGGRVHDHGAVGDVVRRYVAFARDQHRAGEWKDLAGLPRQGSGEVRFVAVSFRGLDPEAGEVPVPDGPLEVAVRLESTVPRTLRSLAITFSTPTGTRLVNADTVLTGQEIDLDAGENVVRVSIDSLHLNPGTYQVSLWAADPLRSRAGGGAYDYIESAFELEVASGRSSGNGLAPHGAVTCQFSASVESPAHSAPSRDHSIPHTSGA